MDNNNKPNKCYPHGYAYQIKGGTDAGKWAINVPKWGGGAHVFGPLPDEATAMIVMQALETAHGAGMYEQRMIDNEAKRIAKATGQQ